MHVLNKIHNLMLNCTSTKELQYLVSEVALDNVFNESYDSVLDTVLVNPVLAADCTILPMYYLQASKATGFKHSKDDCRLLTR